jgi:hypothetical protein
MDDAERRHWRAVARPHLEAPPIPRGTRNGELVSIAGRLRAEGHGQAVIEAVLGAVNRQRCVPPTDPAEVRRIAKWIAQKPTGFLRGAVPRLAYDIARTELCSLAAEFVEAKWHGCAGVTQREVVGALIHLAYRCGRFRIRASERQIAENAAIGRLAVRRALRSAAVRSWVRRVKRGNAEQPSEWELRRPSVAATDETQQSNKVALLLMGADCRTDDAWRFRGLGKNGRHVWNMLACQAPWPSAR